MLRDSLHWLCIEGLKHSRVRLSHPDLGLVLAKEKKHESSVIKVQMVQPAAVFVVVFFFRTHLGHPYEMFSKI